MNEYNNTHLSERSLEAILDMPRVLHLYNILEGRLANHVEILDSTLIGLHHATATARFAMLYIMVRK